MRACSTFVAVIAAIICASGTAAAQRAAASYQKDLTAADPESLWRLGRFDEAERAALERIASRGDDGAARYVLSRCAWSRRDLQTARAEIDAALALDAARPDWNYAGAGV